MKPLLCSCTLFLLSNCCSPVPPTKKQIKNTDYILNNYSFACENARIDSNFLLTPTRCNIIIDSFEQHPFHDQILQTSDVKWMQLIKSDTPDISQSASLWLHFLKHENIGMVEMVMLRDSANGYRQVEIDFWKKKLKIRD